MIAELSIVPICRKEDTADILAQIISKIDESDLNYQLTAMGTLIESDNWDNLMKIVYQCHQIVLANCSKVQTDLKIEQHKGRHHMLKNRINELENIASKRLKH